MTLHIEELVVDHGAIRAIDGVTFSVQKGELATVIGSNGAGKSTLLRTLSGLKAATSGKAMWNNHDLLKGKAEQHVRHGVAHVSEGKSVVGELTVDENLSLGALWRRDSREAKVSRDEVFTLFPRLAERQHQSAETLSGGERQMLAIGRALMSKPELLLLDEPSLGLAPLLVEQIFQAIRGITTSMGLTVLLIEQNAMGALNIADKGIVLNLGKVATTGDAQVLLGDAAVRAAYLGY